MRTRFLIAIVAATLVAASTASAQATDPFIGAWKMDVAKSQFVPGPALKSRSLHIQKAETGLKAIHDGVEVQGKSFHSENILWLDGKEHPSASAKNATSMTRRIDEGTIESVTRTNGQVTLRVRMELSADRKTWTTTQIGTNAQGQAVHNIWVYIRE